MKDKNSTKPSLKYGDLIRFDFYDHSASDNASILEEGIREACKISLSGWLINETDLEYIVEVVRASLPGNSLVWHILKSAVIETEVLNDQKSKL